VLEVRDDGHGFDTGVLDERPKSARLGTLDVRERANLFGGRIEIHSVPGQRTTVRATIALPG